jgi:hypothetical protein
MRRLMGIAAFALLLAVPTWAQRGGGGHAGGFGGGHAGGFGGRAGFSGGHAFGAHLSGGHISSGHPAGRSGFSRGFTRSSNQSHFVSQWQIAREARWRFPRRFDNIGARQFRNRNCMVWGCRGFGYGYYPWGWGYYDPFLWGWWNHDSNYSQDSDNESEYLNQLSAENAELRQMLEREEEDRDQDSYARRPEPRPQQKPQASDEEQSSMMSPTVLVFRDQHKQEVSNYAIVGSTLMAYVPQHNQKIPLSELDIPATVKANDDRGVTFRVPGPNQGQ